jgi:hypothetical protein
MSATDSPERAGPPVDRPAPGWYRDPSGGFEVRWWTGLGWSGHVRQGNADLFAPIPGSRPDGDSGDGAAGELAHLEYVEHFLDLAWCGGWLP